MPESPRRIAIDARYLSHNLVGGVNSYLRNLSLALLRVATSEQFVFWIDGKATFELEGWADHLETRELPWHNALSSIRNDLRIGKAMQQDGTDLVHFPANYGFTPSGLPTLITVHDAINLLPLHKIVQGHSKQPGTIMKMTYLHLATRRAVRHEPFIVTVSQYSRNEILKQVDLDPERVFVAHSAHEQVFHLMDNADVEQLRTERQLRPFVILADAIKNPGSVLRAYRALPEETRQRTSLVFFSRRAAPAVVQEAEARGEAVVFLRPDTSTLVTLYNLADVFVFPSWYEGFGLPVLEAMACGTPVVASSRGSLPEIVGDAGFVVDAEDHTAIAATVEKLLTGELNPEWWQARSIARAGQFSWDRTAAQMLDIYQEVYQRSCREHPFHPPSNSRVAA